MDKVDEIGKVLDRQLNDGSDARRLGFALLVFPINAPPGEHCSFIFHKEIHPKTMVKLLKEAIASLETAEPQGQA